MSLADEIDFEEIRTARAEMESEQRSELLHDMEPRVVTLVQAGREMPTADLFEMVDAISAKVTEMRLNNGELSFLAGLLALSLARPNTLGPAVDSLARHLYDTDPAADETMDSIRWELDAPTREEYRRKAAVLLEVAFDL